jgi:hypothetical protein
VFHLDSRQMIPTSIKLATTGSIGFFLAHLGLQTAEGIDARHSPAPSRHSPSPSRHSPSLSRHSPRLSRHSPSLSRTFPALFSTFPALPVTFPALSKAFVSLASPSFQLHPRGQTPPSPPQVNTATLITAPPPVVLALLNRAGGDGRGDWCDTRRLPCCQPHLCLL